MTILQERHKQIARSPDHHPPVGVGQSHPAAFLGPLVRALQAGLPRLCRPGQKPAAAALQGVRQRRQRDRDSVPVLGRRHPFGSDGKVSGRQRQPDPRRRQLPRRRGRDSARHRTAGGAGVDLRDGSTPVGGVQSWIFESSLHTFTPKYSRAIFRNFSGDTYRATQPGNLSKRQG